MVDLAAANNTIIDAMRSLEDKGVNTSKLDGEQQSALAAAFRQSNTVGSALSSKSLAEAMFPTPDAKPLAAETIAAMATKDGVPLDIVTQVTNDAEYASVVADYKREVEDKRILDASGFGGTLANMLAGVVDLPTLLPFGGGARVARALEAGVVGRGTVAGVFAANAAAGAAVQEAGLQASQVSRHPMESVAAVGGSVLLGGALGYGTAKLLGPAAARALEARVEADVAAVIAAATKEAPTLNSLSAAAVDTYKMMREGGTPTQIEGFSAGAKSLIQSPGIISDKLRNPVIDLMDSASPAAREAVSTLVNAPWITRGNKDGIASAQTVADVVGEFRGKLANVIASTQESFKANKGLYGTEEELGKRVYRAMINGDVDPAGDKVVSQLAMKWRNEVFEPIRKELVASKILPENTDQKTAISYVSRVYNREHIRRNKDAFIADAERQYMNDLLTQRDAAAKVRAEQIKAIEAGTADLTGLKTKMPDGFAADGTPKYKDVVLKKGTLQTQIEEAKAAHTKAIEDIRKEKAQARTDFEAKQKAELGALKEDLNKQLDALAAERDQLLTDLRDTRDMMLSKDAGNNREQMARIRAEYKQAVADAFMKHAKDAAKAEKQAAPKLRAAERKLHAQERDLFDPKNGKFAKNEAAARKARDEAVSAIEADVARQLNELKAKNSAVDGKLRNATDAELEAEAGRLAEGLYRTLTNQKDVHLDYEVTTGVRGYAKGRTFLMSDQALADKGYILDNVFDVGQRYVRTAGTDAAIGKLNKKPRPQLDEMGQKVLGPDGKAVMEDVADLTLSERIKAIRQDFEDEIGKASGEREKQLIKERDRAIMSVEAIRDLMRGTYSTDEGGMFATILSSSAAMKASERVRMFNYLRLMGGAVLSSLNDTVNLAIANGLGPTIRDGIVPMIKAYSTEYKAASGDMRRLSRLANASTEWEMNSRIAAMVGIDDVHSSTDRATTFMRNVHNKFSTYSGITAWNDILTNIGFMTTQSRIVRNAAEGWSAQSKAERAWMANLGIDEAMLSRIKAAHDGQTAKESLGIPFAHFDAWTDREAASAFRNAMDRESKNIVVRPQVGDMPVWTATPAGKLVMQFRSYAFASQARLIGRNAQLAALDGAGGLAGFYTGMVGLVLAGVLIDYTKYVAGHSTITGANKDAAAHESATAKWLKDWEQNPGKSLYEALDRSGAMGPIFSEWANSVDKLSGGYVSMRNTMGFAAKDKKVVEDKGGSARNKNKSPLEVVLGPSAGLPGDILSTAQMAGKLFSYEARKLYGMPTPHGVDPRVTRQDVQTLRRVIPFQNAPILQQVLNEGERRIGAAWHWPEVK